MADGALSFIVDRAAALISVDGRGVWTAGQARDHFARLTDAIVALRAEKGRVRVLVDLREAGEQEPEVATIVRDATGRIYTPLDYIAIVIREGVPRDQMQRLTQALNARLFDDPVGAIRWLDEA